jgi:RimJ/RimL family protein N-acetyltransferase
VTVIETPRLLLRPWQPDGFGRWVAIEKATGRWVGRIGLSEILGWPGPDKIEVGWELHREFWGRGLATEGGKACMGYGFEVAGVPRIMSATMAANTASRRVMDKCGLRFQGELHLPGTVMVWYAVDRVHWQTSQAAAGL